MAFSSSQLLQTQQQVSTPKTSDNEFNSQELELLLGILRETTLKGHQIEVFYNLVVKMQNQYIQQQNK